MLQTTYSNNKLFDLAKENYYRLFAICEQLEQSGYWEKPQVVLNKSIYEILDIYVQSILINLVVYCGRMNEQERKLIVEITSTNALGCTITGDIPEEVLEHAKQIVMSPPILMQLCGLSDSEKATKLTMCYVDSIINILLTMAYFNHKKDMLVMKFIQEYYNKISVFIGHYERKESINPRYIFRKLSSDTIEAYEESMEVQESQVFFGKPEKMTSMDIIKEEFETKQVREIQDKVLELKQDDEKLNLLLDELSGLVGLKGVKDEINSLINLIKVRKLRQKYNMATMDMSYHMVFTGNPGTGKTTVARLVASIYKELGLLSQGNLVETDRSGLVAGYVGQTALKVKEVVESAIGGVLFIDEAYSLTSQDASNDFGTEAIETLVKMMEDHRDNLVVIVAGYNEEMQKFLKSNTGLVSRFNKFISFPDYSVDELIEIMQGMAKAADMEIEDEAILVLKDKLNNLSISQKVHFGNARGIRNWFEKIVVNQANRIIQYDEVSKKELITICKSDAVQLSI